MLLAVLQFVILTILNPDKGAQRKTAAVRMALEEEEMEINQWFTSK
jgi:hypothetical protein